MTRKEMLELGIINDIYTQTELTKLISTGLDSMVTQNMIEVSDKQEIIDLINTKLI